jgi:hypothetical protein
MTLGEKVLQMHCAVPTNVPSQVERMVAVHWGGQFFQVIGVVRIRLLLRFFYPLPVNGDGLRVGFTQWAFLMAVRVHQVHCENMSDVRVQTVE